MVLFARSLRVFAFCWERPQTDRWMDRWTLSSSLFLCFAKATWSITTFAFSKNQGLSWIFSWETFEEGVCHGTQLCFTRKNSYLQKVQRKQYFYCHTIQLYPYRTCSISWQSSVKLTVPLSGVSRKSVRQYLTESLTPVRKIFARMYRPIISKGAQTCSFFSCLVQNFIFKQCNGIWYFMCQPSFTLGWLPHIPCACLATFLHRIPMEKTS